jgi:predicted phage tail protein
MTEVHLHGILAKKYGSKHRIALSKPRDLIGAMEANHDDFLVDLKELFKKNIHYTYVVNGKWVKNIEYDKEKIKRLDFVPLILGSGPIYVGATITWWMIISLLIAIASAVYSFIQAGKVEYPRVPGAEGATSALTKSLAFSNRENIVEQGNPVPLVYGRLKLGSFVIQSSLKSFPLSLSLTDEFINSSTKKGHNQIATIDSSDSEATSPST